MTDRKEPETVNRRYYRNLEEMDEDFDLDLDTMDDDQLAAAFGDWDFVEEHEDGSKTYVSSPGRRPGP